MSRSLRTPRRRNSRPRRPLLEMMEDRLLLATFTVNNTADSGTGSLRQAILDANGNAGPDVIDFSIPGSGVQTIMPASALPTITDPVTIDAKTQPGFVGTPIVVIDGANAGANVDGLTITAGNTTVSGLVIDDFGGSGIVLTGSGGDVIAGNYIGTDATGTVARPNGVDGVSIIGPVSNNTVGGTTAGTRNVISGNLREGVAIFGASGPGPSGTLVEGNYIGTDANGTAALGNGGSGVAISAAATNNTVGGTTAAARNIISGNLLEGVAVFGAGTTGNVVEGNFVGTDVNGTAALGNAMSGVAISAGATNNTVGGSTSGARNIISGNLQEGVAIFNVGTTGNVVEGNSIGLDTTGAAALGNKFDGVAISAGASGNTIGGTSAAARNLISGNSLNGVNIFGASPNNIIEGNYLGTDASGTTAIANGNSGVVAQGGSTGNLIGGTAAGAGNLISGNVLDGVAFTQAGTSGNLAQGNLIGTDVTGTIALPNSQEGVLITAPGNTVGGTAAGARNVISGGKAVGVLISGGVASGNLVQGNYIGVDITGTKALGNAFGGVDMIGAPGNTVGGTVAAARNIISANGDNGVVILDAGADNDVVQGNYIGTDVTGTIALGNKARGVVVGGGNAFTPPTTGFATRGLIGGTAPGAGNLIAGNTGGIGIIGAGATGFVVQGNLIGTDVTGTKPLGNAGSSGVLIQDGSGNTIGGTSAAARNIIAANGGVAQGFGPFDGVRIAGAAANNSVEGNYIGTDITGTAPLGNARDGVRIEGGTGNTIGGAAPGAGNVISGSGQQGVFITAGATGNAVQGNLIGTDATGKNPLGNGGDGVLIMGASGNTIGGTASGAGNIISGNTTDGVGISGAGTTANLVQGNLIGTDATGTKALANGLQGVSITGAAGNTIGGTTPAARNVISGNGDNGVLIVGTGADNDVIQGNLIGTDITGAVALGNAASGIFVGDGSGLEVPAPGFATKALIGGTAAGARNVIAGNTEDGIAIVADGATAIVVQGNYIGTDATGEKALGNANNGVLIQDASGNTIGGTTAAARNVISGNVQGGVVITAFGQTLSSPPSGNLVQGNFIGVDAAGAVALGNGFEGVSISNGANNNTIGGVGAGNLISGNAQNGISIFGAGTSGNLVLGNQVGTDLAGTAAVPNGQDGVSISANALGNTIGGSAAGEGNLVSGNARFGVVIFNNAANNSVQGNRIGTNAAGTAALGNAHDGVALDGPTSGNTIGGVGAGSGNLISGNGARGVDIFSGASNNRVLGNMIGTDITGTKAVPNAQSGVIVTSGSFGNAIGGGQPGNGNLISGNLQAGVTLDGIGTVGNLVQGNRIGTDATGTKAVPNGSHGVSVINGASRNLIGGLPPTGSGQAPGNVIAFNAGSGVSVSSGNGDEISGNSIFANGMLGIDLAPPGVNPNLPAGQTGVGANDLLNYPTLTSVNLVGGVTRVQGQYAGPANETFRIEFFSSAAPDPSGFGQGRTFLGSTSVTTDSSGNAPAFTVDLPALGAQSFVTATATATIPGQPGDGDTSEFSRAVALNVADLSVSLTVNPASVQVGGFLTYTATVTNAGPATAQGVALTDTLPPGVTFVRATPNGAVTPPGGNQVVVNIGAIAANATAVVTLVVQVTAFNSPVRNTVTVTSTTPDTNPANNTANATTPIVPTADLAVQLAGSPGTVAPGGMIEYTAVATNLGPVSVPDAVLTDVLPAGATLAATPQSSQGTVVVAGGRVIASLGTLPVGGTATLLIDVLAPGSGPLVDQATVSSATVIDTNPANNTATVTTQVTQVPSFTVVNTLDDGPGSLRQAIENANNPALRPANGAPPTIDFKIPASFLTAPFAVAGVTPFVIPLKTPLPAVTLPVVIDATTQPGFSGTPIVGIDGANASAGPQGLGANGLTILAGRSEVKGLVITRFADQGIRLSGAGGDIIDGDLIGTDAAGTAGLGNKGAGILIDATSASLIGTPASGNIISGNGVFGIAIQGARATSNVILNNRIGTDPAGAAPVPNGFGGVLIDAGAGANFVGLPIQAPSNVISGNGSVGVQVSNGAHGNAILADFIGTDVTGARALPNGDDGVFLIDAAFNTVGGTDPGARNVISGNRFVGVQVFRPDSVGNVVQGNLIGTDVTGTARLPNGLDGIYINDAPDTLIGGASPAAGNVISGNGSSGLQFFGTNVAGEVVQNNRIGPDVNGAVGQVGNRFGVFINRITNGAAVLSAVSAANTVAGNATNFFTTPLGLGPTVQSQSLTVQGGLVTGLVLTFSGDMDPARAQNTRNYRIRSSAGPVPVRSAVYDVAQRTVTIAFGVPQSGRSRITLTALSTPPRTGLADTQGRALDGNADGIPGGNFVTTLGPATASTTAAPVSALAFDALAGSGRLPGVSQLQARRRSARRA
jgi:uncharacterized repeat protein (TIGR01451 family)